ncbi:hypothetical protein [Stackebrandtia nassauensis]|uniref:Uncharacterized protein n=1 Tax=Stackebrandtia nassauensis (strain DSM 44728 / CIP 108903 / NRRL B-16338 / NBRC 102104 / LLR-40K-21) TaxID=446470 RepID=D3Q4L6_STANL|nr:hypothetical protein [Stackebrandtia nassauensis]ADD40176.1 hypothetical protein Snas_0461 [Stackebrandtia nassauensis DSM 44728]
MRPTILSSILSLIVGGLVFPDLRDIAEWAARRLVKWAAPKWTDDETEAEALYEDWQAVIEDRPGAILKLVTATGFCVSAATRSYGRVVKSDYREAFKDQPSFATGLLRLWKIRGDRMQREVTIVIIKRALGNQLTYRQRFTNAVLVLGFLGSFFGWIWFCIGHNRVDNQTVSNGTTIVAATYLVLWWLLRRRRRKKFSQVSDPAVALTCSSEAVFTMKDPRSGREVMVTIREIPETTPGGLSAGNPG